MVGHADPPRDAPRAPVADVGVPVQARRALLKGPCRPETHRGRHHAAAAHRRVGGEADLPRVLQRGAGAQVEQPGEGGFLLAVAPGELDDEDAHTPFVLPLRADVLEEFGGVVRAVRARHGGPPQGLGVGALLDDGRQVGRRHRAQPDAPVVEDRHALRVAARHGVTLAAHPRGGQVNCPAGEGGTAARPSSLGAAVARD